MKAKILCIMMLCITAITAQAQVNCLRDQFLDIGTNGNSLMLYQLSPPSFSISFDDSLSFKNIFTDKQYEFSDLLRRDGQERNGLILLPEEAKKQTTSLSLQLDTRTIIYEFNDKGQLISKYVLKHGGRNGFYRHRVGNGRIIIRAVDFSTLDSGGMGNGRTGGNGSSGGRSTGGGNG